MIYVENPGDGGSAIWACSTCDRGAWCSDHSAALLEARLHGVGCTDTIHVLYTPGPKPNDKRDRRIRRLRAQGLTVRAIAATVNLSTAGVIKSLKRTENA
ncbi:hypothetical protein [Microbacterium sp. T2.11-28]|uniref:hypothetical protein n=1 Tax=Microbacterium sp. T2.11-28 TaxID=3041169 RepID=UPI002477C426|nr:hypothetical protein [Microbacterium sp. T2.11-28]CAI9386075.1 hypothetical protein MICABA_00159 [Microbacterium sp. T2.11-28]